MEFTYDIDKSRKEVFEKLLQGIEYIYSVAVDGHVAEFGTMSGETATILSLGIKAFSHKLGHSDAAHKIGLRHLFLFDSFNGLPATTNPIDISSPHVNSGVWGGGACRGISQEQLRGLCSQYIDSSRIHILDGWFVDTLPSLEPTVKFALVHIDCDLYESAIQLLDYLFSKDHFSDGCAIFFDDWNCNRASPNFGERRAWAECVDKYKPIFSDCGEYGVCGRKFIVHK